MIAYRYLCEHCEHEFEYHVPMAHRDLPTTKPCPKCNHFEVIRPPAVGGIEVPEGGVGNAKNGYSSYHGDAENFKARSDGRPLPYSK
jgi:hypothetical protein